MATETDGNSTPPADAPPAGADESLDSIVAAEFDAAEKAGIDVTPPPGNLSDDDAPKGDEVEAKAEGDAEAEKPAETVEAKPPAETADAAAARAILAKAERVKAEAAQHVETFKAELLEGFRKAPKATLAKYGLPPIEDMIDAHLAEADGPAATEPTVEDRVAAAVEKALAPARIAAKVAEIKASIATDARFSTINAKGKQQVVLDFMLSYHEKHKVPIAWDKAAALVEKDLRSLTGGAAKPAAKPAAGTAPARKAPVTLENSDGRTAPADKDDPTAGMSPDKALAYLVNELS